LAFGGQAELLNLKIELLGTAALARCNCTGAFTRRRSYL
jgi:hypothetical protein